MLAVTLSSLLIFEHLESVWTYGVHSSGRHLRDSKVCVETAVRSNVWAALSSGADNCFEKKTEYRLDCRAVVRVFGYWNLDSSLWFRFMIFRIWLFYRLWTWDFATYYKKWKYTSAVRSKISSRLIFASCVWYSDRAHYELCALIMDIGRGLPLQLQCSYQGHQGDFRQSVRGNYKTRFWGGQSRSAVEGNVSIYQVYLVSRITGEGAGRSFEGRGGLVLIKSI